MLLTNYGVEVTGILPLWVIFIPLSLFSLSLGKRNNPSLLSLQQEGEMVLKERCVCRPRAEKFNIVSNDHGRTHKCIFRFRLEIPFSANLVKKIRTVSLM